MFGSVPSPFNSFCVCKPEMWELAVKTAAWALKQFWLVTHANDADVSQRSSWNKNRFVWAPRQPWGVTINLIQLSEQDIKPTFVVRLWTHVNDLCKLRDKQIVELSVAIWWLVTEVIHEGRCQRISVFHIGWPFHYYSSCTQHQPH